MELNDLCYTSVSTIVVFGDTLLHIALELEHRRHNHTTWNYQDQDDK